jgi:hypothetical protein
MLQVDGFPQLIQESHNMETIKTYFINLFALMLTSVPTLNSYLQTIVLLLTIAYTGIQIYNKLNGNKD